MPDASTTTAADPRARGRRTLLLIALVAFMPVMASTLIYLFFPRQAGTNYGTLLPTRPAPDADEHEQCDVADRAMETVASWSN